MSAHDDDDDGPPIFRAVSSSTRQIFQLLNCIRFAPKAQIQISDGGIRVSVEESRVIQGETSCSLPLIHDLTLNSLGVAFLDKALFTSFNYTGPVPDDNDDDDDNNIPPSFQISLTALIETLQIFGFSESSNRFNPNPSAYDYNTNIRPGRPNAFSNAALNLSSGVCKLSYPSLGSPLSIILEESGVITTCNLHTYEPEAPEEIPFDRNDVSCKIIMQSRILFDAITELSSITNTSSTSSTKLIVIASPNSPYLSLTTTGTLGSATVEFAKSRELLETFTVSQRWTQSYKFEMVKAAAEAMRVASKVSFRGDSQGVLSLQFMIEVDGSAGTGGGAPGGAVVSFVDFRFVPFVRSEEDESSGEEDDEGEDNEDDEFADDT